MHWSIWLFSLALVRLAAAAATPFERDQRSLDELARRYTKRTPGGIHLPLISRRASSLERRGTASAIGLGDNVDVAYTVLMSIGGITTPVIVDTGSSDLWVMSDACTQGCEGNIPVYPQASFKPSGLDVAMIYGDSTTGTFATGTIGEDTVGLAGLTLSNQYFAAINRTNTSVVDVGAAGIFGLGFPVNSVIWNNVFGDNLDRSGLSGREVQEDGETPFNHPKIKLGSPFPNTHFRRTKFPTLPGLLGGSSSRHSARQTSSVIDTALASFSALGPFITRLVAQGTLSQPMVSVTLQRDSVEVGGNEGVLSIGELPNDVKSDDMTWVPLRGYTQAEGGLPAPSFSPNEVYPIAWEVMVDGVFFDGEKLPASTLSSSTIKLSALIDTGNSLIRGPSDLVDRIYRSIGTTFPCNEPHTLAFQIGGKMFPVDPRDFITQAFNNNVQSCSANLVATDPPEVGGYQFSWSIGTPFLKGVLSSYYYGNLSFPSIDPPKIGFLSTVPSDAGDQLKAAVSVASKAGNFPAVSEPAPSGTVTPALTKADTVTSPTAKAPTSSSAGGLRAPGEYTSLIVMTLSLLAASLF